MCERDKMSQIRKLWIYPRERGAMQPIEEHGTKPSTKEEKTLSAFGQYLEVMCRYLQVIPRRLAEVSGVSENAISGYLNHPRRKPSEETAERLADALEKIAKERRHAIGIVYNTADQPFYLPPHWQQEFVKSIQVTDASCLKFYAFYSYFEGSTRSAEALAVMEEFHRSYGWVIKKVRRRSQSEK